MKDTYTIEGMTCASCAQAVEKNVSKLTGMDSAIVNFATEKLSVTYDDQQVTVVILPKQSQMPVIRQ